MTDHLIFSRQFLTSKLGASSLLSVLAMLAMNLIVLTQPAVAGADLASTPTIEGAAA